MLFTVTISDVAKKAGVSIATVSNVINQNGKVKKNTEQLVLNAIDELGYIPNQIAKGLKTSQTNIIGIMAEDINSGFSSGIIDGICEYAEKTGYTVSLCNLRVNRKVKVADDTDYLEMASSKGFQELVRTNLNLLLTSRICSLIYLATYPRDVAKILPKLNIPVVYAYAYHSDQNVCSVNYDDFKGGKAATEYLISKGHKKIGLISGSIQSYPTHRRMLGYQTALMEHQLPFVPEYICTGHWFYKDGYEQCLRLLSLPDPPTAIFAMSDIMAYGAINAASSKNINVPKDLSVIGFDNLELSSYCQPPLTTIRLPLQEIGIQSCKLAISLVEKKPVKDRCLQLDCRLIERDSVSPLV